MVNRPYAALPEEKSMFDKILGHEFPKKILKTAVENEKISHGYIFYGIEGIGKFSLAKEFAQAIICDNRTGCGNCPKCKQFLANTVTDFQVIDLSLNKEGEQKESISVEETRSLVGSIFLKPFMFDKKVYIINNADRMTVQAQNALLKIFEEPPSYAVIILIVKNISNILPTILSRGVQIRFNPLPPTEIRKYLGGNYLELVSDNTIARSNGSIKNAISIQESDSYAVLRKEVCENFIRLVSENKKSNLTLLYGTFTKNEDNYQIMLDIISSIVYDIINKNNNKLSKNSDFAIKCDLNIEKCYEIFNIITNLSKRLSTNASYPLSVYAGLLEIYKLGV